MIRFSPTNIRQLSRIPMYLIDNDNDDRRLDLIQTPSSIIESVDDNSDLEPELNPCPDNDSHPIIDKDNITFGRTNRGRRELHMCGYSYQVKEEHAITTRWRCIVRSPTCPVTIHTNNMDDSCSHWNGAYHHHSPDENRELIKDVIAKIKARVLLEPHPVVFIAEEEIRNARMTKVQLLAMPLPSAMGTFHIGRIQ
jgi:hypothetical protein